MAGGLACRAVDVGEIMNSTVSLPLQGAGTVPAGTGAGFEGLLEHAKALLAQGRARESEDAFRQLAEFPAYEAEGLYGMGVARLMLGDLETASSFLDQALDRDPANANALYQLGLIAHKRQRHAEARSCYQRALAIDPSHAAALHGARVLGSGPGPAAVRAAGGAQTSSAIYDYLRQDPSLLSRQTVMVMDVLEMTVHPAFTAYAGRYLARFVAFTGMALAVAISWPLLSRTLAPNPPIISPTVARALIPSVIAIAIALAVLALGYVRVRSTRITIHHGRLQIRKGILSRRLLNIDLWRVSSIELERTLLNRVTGDGTLVLELQHQPRPSRAGHGRARDRSVELTGIARGVRLEEIYQQLLNIVFLLRSSPIVKGIIQ